MKRWKIVLPTLLATSGLPLVSLVGCGNEDSFGDYKVSDEDFLIDISLVGIDYMQDKEEHHTWFTPIGEEKYETSKFDGTCQMSPTVFHICDESWDFESATTNYNDKYVWIDDSGDYWSKFKDSKEGDYSETTQASSSDFKIPLDMGEGFLTYYINRILYKGRDVSFNKDKKCYEASWTETDIWGYDQTFTYQFHFFKNKLVKVLENRKLNSLYGVDEIEKSSTLEYKEITPDVPE